MAEIDPFRVLPGIFRKHVTVPFHVLRIWSVLLALLFGYITITGQPGSGVDRSAAWTATEARAISVRGGGVALDIQIWGGKVTFQGDELDGLTLQGTRGSEVRLRSAAGETVFRYKPDDDGDKAKLYGPLGTVAYRIKEIDAEAKIKLRDPGGAELFRVKVKDDGYNVYDGRGERIAKGKLKNGAYVLRSVTGGGETASVSGAGSLEEAAILSIPVEAPYRLLLWYAHGGE